MALKVWFPLNGTFENKGIENINMTSTGLSFSNNGKIGQCLQTTDTVSLNIPQSIYDVYSVADTEISYSLWVKIDKTYLNQLISETDFSTKTQIYNKIIGFPLGTTSNGLSIHLKTQDNLTQSTQLNQIYIYGYLRTSSANSGSTPQLINLDQWYHLVLSYSKTNVFNFYINGTLIDTQTIIRDNINNSILDRDIKLNIPICQLSNSGASKVHLKILKEYFNDVRIYNHALSAAEVKEISQGLVLHYKLDSFQGGYGNPNLGNTSATYSNQQNGVEINASGWGGDTGKVTYYHSGGYAGLPYKVYHKTATGNGGIYYKTANDIILEANTTYTMSIWIKASREFSGSDYSFCINRGSDNRYITYGKSFTIKTEWTYYTKTFTTPSDGAGSYGEMSIIYDDAVTDYYVYFSGFKIEKGSAATVWCPPGASLTQIQDSSGYNHNGTINGTLTLSNDAPRYSACAVFNGTDTRIKVPNLTPDAITVSFWMKRNANTGTRQFLYTAWFGVTCELTTSGTTTFAVNKSSYPTIRGSTITTSSGWIHYCGTFDTTSGLRLYENGVLKSSNTSNLNTINWSISANYIGYYNTYYNGLMSDFRIYCTALSADDIKQLYQVGAKIDNLGRLHTFEAVENFSNIIFKIDSARGAKVFQNGLSNYTQANCQVTLTDNGYRIYRPPNLSNQANGGSNNMWGGLKLVNQITDTVAAYDANRDNNWNLQQGHTYLFALHVKGQSSNETAFSWTNNMGWDGGGLSPSTTVLINNGIPTNFQGEKDCIFVFTIGDTIAKNCTSAYSSYIAGTTYLSYRHLTFGWYYTNTGTLGTDVYLTDFRLYDITNTIGKIKKNGQASFTDFVEHNGISKILKNSEFLTNILIER